VTDQRSHYRKELDGLRALAILPVILFHAGFIRLATTVMVSKRSLAVSAHDDLAGLGD
jgi:peptidoglycan/LPS O-acetylase OafA/YrhL